MVPSIGFEPMTFPMSRERATPAPTGLKTIRNTHLSADQTANVCFWRAFPTGNELILLALRQLGLNLQLLYHICY